MKCWNAWYDVGSLTRASIADIDLRALSPSKPVDILAQRHVLRAMAEAVLELIQPPRQSSQQRPRVPIEHCGAAYRNQRNCTMSSILITRGFLRESDDVTKSY